MSRDLKQQHRTAKKQAYDVIATYDRSLVCWYQAEAFDSCQFYTEL